MEDPSYFILCFGGNVVCLFSTVRSGTGDGFPHDISYAFAFLIRADFYNLVRHLLGSSAPVRHN